MAPPIIRRRTLPAQHHQEQVLVERPAPTQAVTHKGTTTAKLRTTSVDNAATRLQTAERAKLAIEKELAAVALAEKEIEEAQAKIAQSHKVIEAQMRLGLLSHHNDGSYEASLVESFTRQQRNIDPKKFCELITASASASQSPPARPTRSDRG